jgi:hypothetical protein
MKVRPCVVRLIKVVLAAFIVALDFYFVAPLLGALIGLLGLHLSPRFVGILLLSLLFFTAIFVYEFASAVFAVGRERKDADDV